jgi:cytochrome c553
MRFLRAIRAVLWSVFGVRRGSAAARELETTPPAIVVAAAVAVMAMIVVAIVILVRVVIVGPPRQERPAPAAALTPASVQPKLHGPVRVRDTMEERVAACTSCHADTTQQTRDGFSPRIAGKPAGYLFNQLVSFRDGRRTSPQMVYFTQNLSDAYLREMADYFSGLDKPYSPPEPPSLSAERAARAQRIVQQGDPARNVPACVECHGKSLAGLAPDIPGILGLPRHYMNAQFGTWRAGKLRALEPDCMGEVARRLAPEDAPLLATWLAAQAVPAGGLHPETKSRTLPLECGTAKPQAAMASPAQAPASGAYLAAAGDCVACHTALGGQPFAGGRAIETPFGTVYSTNITPDMKTGIGAWSREDFARALHEGRAKDGRLLYPAFPYANFTKMAPADVDATFGFLRGLPAVSRPNTPHALRFPYSSQAALGVWRLLFFSPGRFQAEPARGTEWNRGAYLVQALGHCDACHAGRNMFGAVSHSLDLGGGLIPMQNWYAPPLASGAAEDIVPLLRTGISRRAAAMGPMAEVVFRSTSHLSAADTAAIATYLQSLPAGASAKKNASHAEPEWLARGEVVYGEHCAQCHGDRGEGAFPAYPALAGNPSVTNPVAANAIKAVLNGGFPPSTAGNPRPYGMPPYAGRLSEADIAAVLSYVRGSWGNAEAPVSTLDIERYR